jgi:hypothetical protein
MIDPGSVTIIGVSDHGPRVSGMNLIPERRST